MKKKSQNKKYFFNLLLFLFSFFITDFITTDIFNRLISQKETVIKKTESYGIKHDKFHHHLKENISIEEEFNGQKYTVKTNSLGFRDKEVKNINYENIGKRLVLIGDSFTFGVISNYEDTFAGIIDDQLSQYGGSNEWEVLNLGVSSYSPVIYYNKIKYFLDKGLKFTHLAVFIDISDVEDESIFYYYDTNSESVQSLQPITTVQSVRSLTKSKLVLYFKNNFFITYNIFNYFDDSILFLRKRIKEYKKSEEKYLKNIHSNLFKRDKWTIDQNIYNEYQIGIDNSLKYLKLLKLLCDKHNIKMYIAVYPWSTQLYYKDLESIQVKIWKEFSQENNVEFINLFPLFLDRNDDKEDINKKIKKYYIPFDVHFNKEGNKIIADYFLKVFNR
jgi:hypothetical protein